MWRAVTETVGEQHMANRNGQREQMAGEVGASQLILIAAVALVGAGAFTALGTGMDRAIDGDKNGEGIAVAVAAQAGASATPPPVSGDPSNAGAPVTVVSVEPGALDFNRNDKAELKALLKSFEARKVRADGGKGEDCGWNPICHVGNAASAVSDFGGAALGKIGDAGRWLGKTPFVRTVGGFLDGAWDALYGMGKGLLTAVWRVGWDFVVEDLIVGNVRGLSGFACKLVTAGAACKESSWNPYEQTTDSLLNFAKKIPDARHAVGDALHQASLCVNPWNGQAAQDRGHACGETFVAIADVVIGTKGAGKAGKLARVATKADDVAEVAAVARRATKLDELADASGSVRRVADESLDPVVVRNLLEGSPYRSLDEVDAATRREWVRVRERNVAGLEPRRADLVDELDDLQRSIDASADGIERARLEMSRSEIQNDIHDLDQVASQHRAVPDPPSQRAFATRKLDALQKYFDDLAENTRASYYAKIDEASARIRVAERRLKDATDPTARIRLEGELRQAKSHLQSAQDGYQAAKASNASYREQVLAEARRRR